jgi:ribosomal protein L16 Arg81 hydroxylase
VTPLHHDTANVLFCQAFGKKKITLFPAFELFLTHDAHHGVHSPIDLDHPDLEAYPQFSEAMRKEVELSPGEGLLIPLGWWHHVRALDVSISVSFTNFRRPNYYDWYYPGLVK